MQYAMFGKGSLGLQLALLFLHQGALLHSTNNLLENSPSAWLHNRAGITETTVMLYLKRCNGKQEGEMFCCATGDRPCIIPGIQIIVYNYFNYVNHFKKLSKYKTYFLKDAPMETHAICENKTRYALELIHKKSIIYSFVSTITCG